MDSLDAEPAWCGFFMPQHPDLVGGELWSESTWADRFRESDEAWIAQTYHRLRAAGYPVLACDHRNALEVPAIVTHPPHTPQLFAIKGIDHVAVAVTIADKTYGERGADLAIVQNSLDPAAHRRFVPHWPQAAMCRRSPSRKGVRRACYKGRRETLHPGLLAPTWVSDLNRLGIEWSVDEGVSSSYWGDYSETDVVVAIRPSDRDTRKAKPATKLVNAWLAGVPAVLGDEPQYRELRCCGLDYLEARTPAEAVAAIRRLAGDADLYSEMVAHGLERSRAFDAEAVTTAWVHAIVDLRGRHRSSLGPASAYRRGVTIAYRRYLAGRASLSARGNSG